MSKTQAVRLTHASPFRHSLLEKILTQPSAPFREGHVISALQAALKEGKVPHFQDPVGNVVVGAGSLREYRALLRLSTEEPLRLFIAHMDHPGFHGVRWLTPSPESPRRLEFRWHGGSPTEHLEGAGVWLADRGLWRGQGRVREARLRPRGGAIESGVIELEEDLSLPRRPIPDGAEIFGGFGFRAPVWLDGELLYTRAADDLVGAFAITSLALDVFAGKKRASPPFLGLLTRGEEVGFIGAIGHFELGWLAGARRPVLCVSLETSRALPGAEIGKGPVVRLGDRFTVFDPGALRVFSDLAEKTLAGRHQRRIMDGGTCEASAATVFGHPSIGISVPLGNYHNQHFEGGPDSRGPLGPAPEFVHLSDVQGLLELCHALLARRLRWGDPWAEKLRQFRKLTREYRALLRSSP